MKRAVATATAVAALLAGCGGSSTPTAAHHPQCAELDQIEQVLNARGRQVSPALRRSTLGACQAEHELARATRQLMREEAGE
jgi:hypothetical protein